MATESKTSEQIQSNATTGLDSDETNTEKNVEKMLHQLSDLFQTQLPVEQKKEEHVLQTFDLASAAKYMMNCSNIIVMSGAGISTSAGIPDFRSPGTGLYSQLEKYNLPEPEAIFQLDYFRENPKPFYLLAKNLYPKNFLATPTHYFIRLLYEKGKLLRIFTQNIDSLERIAGIPVEKIVEAHGTFFTAHCLDCQKEYPLEHIKDTIFKDKIPYCHACKGIIKPDIVFFGESLPERFTECIKTDFPKCDFLIIIGTSLEVAPFNTLIQRVDENCPRLLINMEPVGNKPSLWTMFGGMLMFDSPKNRRDVFHKSTCDDGVTELAKLLGWDNDFKKLLAKEMKSFAPPNASVKRTSMNPIKHSSPSTASSTMSVKNFSTSTSATSNTARNVSSIKATSTTVKNAVASSSTASASTNRLPGSTKTSITGSSKSPTRKTAKK